MQLAFGLEGLPIGRLFSFGLFADDFVVGLIWASYLDCFTFAYSLCLLSCDCWFIVCGFGGLLLLDCVFAF